MFPCDPHCVDKAGPMLDLSAGRWQGQPLGPKDPIRSADEQTSIQARRGAIPRCLPRRAARPISQTGGVLNVEIRRTQIPTSSVLMEGRRSALSRYLLFQNTTRFAQFIRICRWLKLVYMWTRSPQQSAPLCTRLARKRRRDTQLLSQCLRATKCDKLSDPFLVSFTRQLGKK